MFGLYTWALQHTKNVPSYQKNNNNNDIRKVFLNIILLFLLIVMTSNITAGSVKGNRKGGCYLILLTKVHR